MDRSRFNILSEDNVISQTKSVIDGTYMIPVKNQVIDENETDKKITFYNHYVIMCTILF